MHAQGPARCLRCRALRHRSTKSSTGRSRIGKLTWAAALAKLTESSMCRSRIGACAAKLANANQLKPARAGAEPGLALPRSQELINCKQHGQAPDQGSRYVQPGKLCDNAGLQWCSV